MSIEAMSWAMRHSQATLGARLVLFVLADHAHSDGSESFPSVATICERAHLSRRAAQSALAKLQELGEIHEDGVGRNGTRCWRLCMGGAESAPPPGGRSSRHEGGVVTTPKPSIEPPTSISARASKRVRVNGQDVPQALVADAVHAVDHYAEATGQSVRPWDSRDNPTDSLTRVMNAMVRFPEVRTLWPRMIDRVLSVPWWDGEPHIGVIFGPGAVEKSIAKAQSRGASTGQRRLPQPEDFAHLFPRSRSDA